MAPLKIRLVDVEANPTVPEAAVYSAALSMALRWQCDVRVRLKHTAFLIKAADAQTAALVLAQNGAQRPPSRPPTPPPGRDIEEH